MTKLRCGTMCHMSNPGFLPGAAPVCDNVDDVTACAFYKEAPTAPVKEEPMPEIVEYRKKVVVEIEARDVDPLRWFTAEYVLGVLGENLSIDGPTSFTLKEHACPAGTVVQCPFAPPEAK